MGSQSDLPGTLLAPAAGVGDPRPADIWRGQRNRFLIEDARNTGNWMHTCGGGIQAILVLIFLDADYP